MRLILKVITNLFQKMYFFFIFLLDFVHRHKEKKLFVDLSTVYVLQELIKDKPSDKLKLIEHLIQIIE